MSLQRCYPANLTVWWFLCFEKKSWFSTFGFVLWTPPITVSLCKRVFQCSKSHFFELNWMNKLMSLWPFFWITVGTKEQHWRLGWNKNKFVLGFLQIMALEIKREWHVVPATKKFADVPTEWPAKEHERFALPYGPSEGRIVSFMRASRIRNRLLFTLNPTGYTEDTYVTKEGVWNQGNWNFFCLASPALRRQALAESKNLWYLPERPVVADQLETIVNRSTFCMPWFACQTLLNVRIQLWWKDTRTRDWLVLQVHATIHLSGCQRYAHCDQWFMLP